VAIASRLGIHGLVDDSKAGVTFRMRYVGHEYAAIGHKRRRGPEPVTPDQPV